MTPSALFCRMLLVAAGVMYDWVSFIEKSGCNSGTLARVIPILGHGHKFARLGFERLVEYDFPFNGLKKVLGIMELVFQSRNVADAQPPLKLQLFWASTLDLNYKKTYGLLIDDFKDQPNIMHSTPSVMNSAARRYSLTYTGNSLEDSKKKWGYLIF